MNVLEYGAKGDGVTDDTLSVQSAINNAKNGTVYLPMGIYLVTSLIIDYSTHLIGEGWSDIGHGGSIIKSKSALPIISIKKPTQRNTYYGAVLNDFSIIGNLQDNNGNNKQSGINVDKEGSTIFERISISNCGDYAIRLAETTHVSCLKIKNCILTKNAKGGIYGRCRGNAQINAITINDNIIGTNGYGINVTGNNLNIRRNTIQNNNCSGICLSNNDCSFSGGAKNVIIDGNYFEGNKEGEILVESDLSGTVFNFHNNIEILNNYFNTDLNKITKEDILASITVLSNCNWKIRYFHLRNSNNFRLRNGAVAFSGIDTLDETSIIESPFNI